MSDKFTFDDPDEKEKPKINKTDDDSEDDLSAFDDPRIEKID